MKVLKNKAYFKRFQVKYRRRRDGKTDYHQRRRLVIQDKNKYQTPRYRLVVRLTNQYVVAQIIHSNIDGDIVDAAANSAELRNYGVKAGLKNYAAAYATGLLVARRVLKKFGLEALYKGSETVDGKIHTSEETLDSGKTRSYFVPTLSEERRPFRAVLDVGVRHTTTGSRIFGALKGASDGGIDIPHNERRFPGYDAESKEYDAEVHKARIFGEHIANYMRELKDEDEEAYARQFARFIEAGVDADAIEGLYTKLHAAIRAKPDAAAKKTTATDKKWKHKAQRNLKERRNRVVQKKESRLRRLERSAAAASDDEGEDDE